MCYRLTLTFSIASIMLYIAKQPSVSVWRPVACDIERALLSVIYTNQQLTCMYPYITSNEHRAWDGGMATEELICLAISLNGSTPQALILYFPSRFCGMGHVFSCRVRRIERRHGAHAGVLREHLVALQLRLVHEDHRQGLQEPAHHRAVPGECA